MLTASSSGMVIPKSSSNDISISTISRLSAPRSSTTAALSEISLASIRKINVDAFNELIILRVEQLSLNSRPAFYINEFFIRKFNAKPLDFEKYKF